MAAATDGRIGRRPGPDRQGFRAKLRFVTTTQGTADLTPGDGRDPAGVVVVNPSGRLAPVVFFFTWEREREDLQILGEALGPDQPLYGIDHPPIDGPLPRDLTDWVEFHRERFDRLPIEPPYQLAGFSFGGVIALEIAMQLRAEGHEIRWLGLVDTIRPILNPTGLRPYLRYHLRELIDQPDPARRRAYVRVRVLGGGRRTLLRLRHQVLRPLRRAGLFPASRGATLADTRGLGALKKAVWRGYLSHEARFYDAPVALFTGYENRRQAGGDPSLRWAKYLRNGLEVIALPGAHREILRPPNVEVAACEIAASLARADERSARAVPR